MEMKIILKGESKVEAEIKDHVIETDQPVHRGGSGTAPAPFDYFLASIGTCAGFYVQNFLAQRNLAVGDVRIVLSTTKDPATKMLSRVDVKVTLPDGFPEKYERAIVKAIDVCSVKKHILTPPTFTTTLARFSDGRESSPTSGALA